jgi:hypothetical protein
MSILGEHAVGDAPVEVTLWLPVGDALATVVELQDADGDAIDQTGVDWEAIVLQPSDGDWAGWTIEPTVDGGTLTLTATADAIGTALGDRTGLRWQLRNTTTDQTVLAGPVRRIPRGSAAQVPAVTATVQINDVTLVVSGPTLVVGVPAEIDGGTPSSTFNDELDGGGP